VQGDTLRQLIDREGGLPVTRAADIAYQVADALAVAHARGLVHRDVKPGNVLVQPDGRVKVTDFGIAKVADSGGDELTRTGMVVGTARYLAPEQVDGRDVDERVDVYSLGLVLYEMLCGRAPFEADTDIATAVARLTAPPPPITTERPDIPIGLEHVIDRALARDPAERWPSALAFRDAIRQFRTESGPPSADATIPVRLPPRPPQAAPAGVGAAAPPPPAAARRLVTGPRMALWISVFVIGVVAGYLGYRAVADEPVSNAAPRPAPVAGPLPIVSAADYDPAGDQRESHNDVPLVIDNNTATEWKTEQYRDRDVGGLKPGVGLVLDLGSPKRVERVDIATPDEGWDASVYTGDTVPDGIDGWGRPQFTGQGLAGPEAQLALDPPTRARYVLFWITNLPPGAPYVLHVGEVRVIGSS
jgi:serine/threonine-protein kinase